MDGHAFLSTAGPDRAGSALNGVEYALSIDDAGYPVRVYLDGAATKWPGELETTVDHPLHGGLTSAIDRGLVEACAYCADAFGATDGCRDADIGFRGVAGEQHGPNNEQLMAEGFTLHTVG